MKPRILWCNESSVLHTGYATYGREVLKRLHATGKYTLAEHAIYIEASDPRIQNLPWVVYANLPNKNNQDEVNRYNSNTSNQFGEWRFEEIACDFKMHGCADIRDAWMCFVKGCNIVTKSYIKNVEDIKVGDEVLTHKGRYKKVLKIFKRDAFENINVIRASHCPFEVILTDEHPVLMVEHKKGSYLPKLFQDTPKWTKAKNINKGDTVFFPIDKFGTNELPLDVCRLIGYYTAEGCLMYEGVKKSNILKGIQLTMNANEKEYIEDIRQIVKEYYNREIKVKVEGNTANIRIFNRQIALDMENYANSLAGDKKWSDFIFHMNEDCCKHLLCGLFRGDGGYYERRASYCTKSKQLAHQIFRICLRFNILPSFNLNNNTYNGKIFQRYIFSFRKSAHQNFINIYNLNQLENINNNRIQDGYALLTIRSVNTYVEPEEVYNFKVEDDESYVSSFAVHNCSHEYRSPLRPYYNWTLMPTVDAFPQNPEWLSNYSDADGVFTYQDWSKEVLDFEGGGRINTLGAAPPAADDAFRPMNKQLVKKNLGLDNKFVIGTVMRNQRRKLFPELFASFRIFLNETERNDVILHCHTSYPDMGWNIPDLLLKYNLTSKVTFTYKCKHCKHCFVDFFHDIIHLCPNCNQMAATFCSVQDGLDNESLARIYNSFDLYVQYANSEGFGMPQLEAAACAVPVLSVDYSAMSDVIRKLNSQPIPLLTMSLELETGCFRAVPNNIEFIKILKHITSLPSEKLEELRQNTLQAYHNNYGWDKTAQKWMSYFDNIDVEYYERLWKSPPNFINIPTEIPPGLNNKDFARWLITNFLGEQRFINSYMEARLIRDLNYGVSTQGISGMYYNDESASPLFRRPNWKEFNREIAVNHFTELAKRKNAWENRRWQCVKE